MKYAIAGMSGFVAVSMTGTAVAGFAPVYELSFGTFSLMALSIAATFCWLYRHRSTPLALGMAFSWFGAACITGWWFFYALFGRPEFMIDNPLQFVFVAFYMTGALLHFRVIGSSLAWPRITWFLVPLLAFLTTLLLVTRF
jgi:hypothetical protein